mmetsp:Transcript_19251/g.41608  ORF Transcript_19251/g.41608 Transcript_19251/m.41608 type:complete len:232 (+) Transcript_19251:661-1356(+)
MAAQVVQQRGMQEMSWVRRCRWRVRMRRRGRYGWRRACCEKWGMAWVVQSPWTGCPGNMSRGSSRMAAAQPALWVSLWQQVMCPQLPRLWQAAAVPGLAAVPAQAARVLVPRHQQRMVAARVPVPAAAAPLQQSTWAGPLSGMALHLLLPQSSGRFTPPAVSYTSSPMGGLLVTWALWQVWACHMAPPGYTRTVPESDHRNPQDPLHHASSSSSSSRSPSTAISGQRQSLC